MLIKDHKTKEKNETLVENSVKNLTAVSSQENQGERPSMITQYAQQSEIKQDAQQSGHHCTRRSFLHSTFASLTLPTLLTPSLLTSFMDSGILDAQTKNKDRRPIHGTASKLEKKLSFYNTHTGESVKNIVFWANEYICEGLDQLNTLFRDHRTGDIEVIDKKLWELLYLLHQKLETTSPFHLISGFRSLKTNRMLCAQSDGVAKHSQHTLGKAADIALPKSHSIHAIQKAAKALRLGGVGAYSQFVHVDVGRVRYW